MPYIKQEDRDYVSKNAEIRNAGELNYLIHLEIEKYINSVGEGYNNYNNVIGVLKVLENDAHALKFLNSEQEKNYRVLFNNILYLLKLFNKEHNNFVECMGALECVRHELYRRRIKNYEIKKSHENGDIHFYKGYY